MFALEGHANLTIPNFNSTLVSVRIIERSRNEYELNFAGTWFSGHNITVRGTYSDRSTAVTISHNLKLLLKSPSFANDFLLNCKLFQNASDLRVGLFMEQINMDKYAFIFNHTATSLTQITTYIEGKYKNTVYSVLANVDTNKEVRMEIHLDRWRDVHVIGTGFNDGIRKEVSFELKWDANRDPTLKIATILECSRYIAPMVSPDDEIVRNMSAGLTITYPGRFITLSCLVAQQPRNNYIFDTQLTWSPEKKIHFTIDTDYEVQDSIQSVRFDSELLTPFENWKKTGINAK